ncbi:MAG TPA: right-handed parallel beta-helix repeat-containing protein [Bryobacteraceae bacterium]|nr:right-handed parallel beta-helix repeat-containing protein [Bryobacteraceae bacterium]
MRVLVALTITLALSFAILAPRPRHILQLPRGIVDVHSEMAFDGGTEVVGDPSGTVLRAAPGFEGRAVIVVRGNGVRLRDFTIDGNREALEVRSGLPPSDQPFARFTRGNGVLAEDVNGLDVERVRFCNIAGFAVLVSRSRDVSIDRVRVSDSGSRTPLGRNNATGGILLEEGTTDFRVTRSELRDIRGNGVWTHSLYTSPRNARGLFSLNFFENVGRDALQVGHATDVRVEQNTGRRIGFPVEDVDIEDRAVPAALDTAGNVEGCSYALNRFEEIDGKCMDLDGFHDGEIRGNQCVNRAAPEQYRFGNYGIVMNNSNPDMQSRNILIVGNVIDGPLFGGIFVIGTGHRIVHNRLLNLNTAHCNEDAARFGCYYGPGEPDMLRSGVYLGRGAERPAPARDNIIEDNEITGFKMDTRSIALAPGILPGWNILRGNRCHEVR